MADITVFQFFKDFQTIIAAIIALGAAGIALFSAQRAAQIAAKAALATKTAELDWQYAQAAQALEFKRSAFVTWLFLRCGEAGDAFVERGVLIGDVETACSIMPNLSSRPADRLIKGEERIVEDPEAVARQQDKRDSILVELAAVGPFFSTSELAAVPLDLLIQLQTDDQRLYSAAVLSIKRADRNFENCQRALRNASPLSSNAALVDILIREKTRLLERIGDIRQVEERARGRMNELSASTHSRAARNTVNEKAASPGA